ncbi:MAG TPA: pyrroline-5-carboxylate reductase [Actinomycetota bacterium]|nr:pyrroline-5-carboxylate reductase [Actinomycetota bacterium]
METHMAKLTILGAGKMGEALVAGLLASGWRSPGEIVATARRRERADELARRYGIEATLDNASAVSGADVVVLAVKPQDVDALLADVSAHVSRDQTVLSVVAAIPTAFIEARLDDGVPVVRAMPNTPSIVHEGMAGIAGGRHADAPHLEVAQEVLAHVGRVVAVSEPYLDAVTAISGSGPAYFALLAEAMIEAGILLGLSREISTELVVQTMLGSAKLLRDERMHPVELREMVTSPGGTTIRAIRVLEQSGVRAAFLNAIQAAMERSQELAGGAPEA